MNGRRMTCSVYQLHGYGRDAIGPLTAIIEFAGQRMMFLPVIPSEPFTYFHELRI